MTENKKHICKNCDKPFDTPWGLTVHERTCKPDVDQEAEESQVEETLEEENTRLKLELLAAENERLKKELEGSTRVDREVDKRMNAKIEDIIDAKDDAFFYLVVFEPKRGKNDPQQVPVSHNGRSMNFGRGHPVPLHEGQMENFRHAKLPVYEDPDEDEMGMMTAGKQEIVGHTPRYPMQMLGKINKAAYLAAKKLLIDRETPITSQEAEQLLDPAFMSFDVLEEAAAAG